MSPRGPRRPRAAASVTLRGARARTCGRNEEDSVSEISPDEQRQIDAKWAELQKAFQDAKTHPVCLKLMTILLADDGVSWRPAWTKPMVEAFWKHLDAAQADKTVKKAVEDLIYFAAFLHHQLDRFELAAGVLVLLNEAVVKYKLVDIDVDAKFEAAGDGKGRLVTGAKDRAVPALAGAARPQGALRPDQFGGNKRRI